MELFQLQNYSDKLGVFTLRETRAKLVLKTVVKTEMFGHVIWATKNKTKSRKP